MKQKKKRKAPKPPIMTPNTIGVFALFILLVFIFASISTQKVIHKAKLTKHTIVTKPTAAMLPTPTIDTSLANTVKTYVSDTYGFTVTYPALGEDSDGHVISCGNHIEELITSQNEASTPTIHIDSMYQITLHPWGAQLYDYLQQQDNNIFITSPFYWTKVPNVDETILFTSKDTQGYFKDIFALYKKGNLIYQVEKPQGYTAGCQTLFDPRDSDATPLAKNQSDMYQSLLLGQYQSWDEATSIQFSK